MNGTIEFVLRMKDMMSSSIARASSNSTSAFNQMSRSANQATSRNNILGLSYNQLQSRIREVENTVRNSTIPSQIAAARRELESLQRASSQHAGNTSSVGKTGGIGVGGVAMGTMLGGFAMQGLAAVGGLVKSSIGTMISQSFEKENAITGLTTFLGKDGAKEAYANIRQDAKVTPYDTTSLLEVNRALISAGLGAKEARTDTMNLANAVAAVGGGNDVLSRMAANMQQIKTVGKATAMDIRQFGMAGINVYEMLSRSTGKSIDQVKEMDVSYEDLAKSLQMANAKGGIYDGALTALSNTREAKWGSIVDNVKMGLGDLADAFNPIIIKVLDIGSKLADNIAPMIERAAPYIAMISDRLGRAMDYLLNIKNTTGGWMDYVIIAKNNFSIIWDFISSSATKLWNLVSSIMEFVKQSEILKDVFRGIGVYLSEVFKTIEIIMSVIVWVWNTIVEPMLRRIELMYKLAKLITGGKISSESKISIADMPKLPGEGGAPFDAAAAAALITNNKESGKAAGQTVSGAGPKVVNITVGKFFDNLQFTTLNSNETASEIEKIVMECFARVVYNGSKMV